MQTPGSGLLAYGSSYSLPLPSRTTSGFAQVSSPFTVAGQHRTCTGFPVLQGVQVTTCTLDLVHDEDVAAIISSIAPFAILFFRSVRLCSRIRRPEGQFPRTAIVPPGVQHVGVPTRHVVEGLHKKRKRLPTTLTSCRSPCLILSRYQHCLCIIVIRLID